jgi:hypothetical protein
MMKTKWYLSVFDRKFLASCHIQADGRRHWSDELFLHSVGVAPLQYRTSDGTQRLLDKFQIPQTRENYLLLAFGGNPPAELDGEVEAELPEEFRLWDTDDICDAPSAGWCGEPSHTPVDPDEDDEED